MPAARSRSDRNALAWITTASGWLLAKWSAAPERFARLSQIARLTHWLDGLARTPIRSSRGRNDRNRCVGGAGGLRVRPTMVIGQYGARCCERTRTWKLTNYSPFCRIIDRNSITQGTRTAFRVYFRFIRERRIPGSRGFLVVCTVGSRRRAQKPLADDGVKATVRSSVTGRRSPRERAVLRSFELVGQAASRQGRRKQ